MTNYLATAHCPNADFSCETHEIGTLMNFLSEHEEAYQEVINNDTGEVLYIGNNPSGEDYLENEFMYTVVGWMCMGEPEPDPREEIIRDAMEVYKEFGATFLMPQ